MAGVPAGLAAALVVFVTGCWGLHIAIYGAQGNVGAQPMEHLTHTPNVEHPHDAMGMNDGLSDAANADAAYRAAMDRMHGPMMSGIADPDPDIAFVRGMIPHHQGAVDMAETVLRFGKDPRNQHFARDIIETQTREISEMRNWLRQRGIAEQP